MHFLSIEKTEAETGALVFYGKFERESEEGWFEVSMIVRYVTGDDSVGVGGQWEDIDSEPALLDSEIDAIARRLERDYHQDLPVNSKDLEARL